MIYVFITYRRSAFVKRVSLTTNFVLIPKNLPTVVMSRSRRSLTRTTFTMFVFDRSLLRERDTQSIQDTQKTKTRAKTIIDATDTNPLSSDKQIYPRDFCFSCLYFRVLHIIAIELKMIITFAFITLRKSLYIVYTRRTIVCILA